MKIIIVDENDNEIGFKERGELDYNEDIYRVFRLWIINEGKSLVAKRSLNKSHHPGKWGSAVAGTVDEGKTYGSNIVKETEKELGLKNINPKKFFKEFIGNNYRHFTQWFILEEKIDLEKLKLKEDEVEEVRWFDLEEVRDLIKTNKTVTLSDELTKRLEENEI
ncbi:hypothetical protein COU62_02815 [Candidatus Pacearchaeota archaeon CG10_big_fil_rev_8_21_14_0_10_35_219]|nr:NUDIX domain-containing protein [Candidatus Pacearchaeota archaeon]PIO07683.1 MAG: hypothetical protein COU62_02815 [Candidatus Pacearchaeota archaeon CG10_big_fil_rev_8_21_14_0_10_35_219]PIY81449.1 MAG: hypothetical protein COY79_02625 [Candidatus Pacearchaeota archaeon CG_4_10_14_0_8_um_filter_35_169]PIZ79484.1 MAG: hypothetical protein COY00_03935 [Candidatus Pacearchaeota archaeon CG_4_10_14_0_2_um_filter_35_33]PJA69782.1 MAG: hypothetical protein CO155_03450 [Candidatus Pacearchaeota ar